MKSYLTIWFNSDGASPTEITERLMSMGFQPQKGEYDYVYNWGSQPHTEDALNLANQVHATLKGCNALFKIETL